MGEVVVVQLRRVHAHEQSLDAQRGRFSSGQMQIRSVALARGAQEFPEPNGS